MFEFKYVNVFQTKPFNSLYKLFKKKWTKKFSITQINLN